MIRINLCFTPPPRSLGDVTEAAGARAPLFWEGAGGLVGEEGVRGSGGYG